MRILFSDVFVIIVVLIKICSSITNVNYHEYCPEGYTRLPIEIPICILITKNSTQYGNECLNSGSTPIAYYSKLIEKPNAYISRIILKYMVMVNVTEVWLPIKENANYLLFWDLPGPMKLNGRTSEISLANIPTNYCSGDCIVYSGVGKTIRLEDCNRAYQHLCLIDPQQSFVVPSKFCESQFIGRLSKFHESCFTINDFGVGQPAEVNGIDTFVVIDQLITKLGKQNKAIMGDVPFTLLFDSSAFQQDRIKTNVRTHQVVRTQRYIRKTPSIDIEFNTISNQLTVIVTNCEFLWNPKNPETPFWCYKEMDIFEDSEIKTKYEEIYNSTTIKGFQTQLSDNDNGIATIWCEGQTLKTFRTIQSNRLTVERNITAANYVMCTKLNLICDQPCKIATEFGKLNVNITEMKQYYFPEFTVKEVQTKQILLINQNTITLLLHFVLYWNEDDAEHIKDTFHQNMREFIAEDSMTDIRFSNLCESLNDYYFASAKLNERVLSKELCYNSDGFLPYQDCVGNLIEGAHWQEIVNTSIYSQCSMAFVTNQTIELFNVTNRLAEAEDHQTIKGITHLVDQAIELMTTTIESADAINDTRLVLETIHTFAEIKQINVFDVAGQSKKGQAPSDTIKLISEMINRILELEKGSLLSDGNNMLGAIDKLTTQFAKSNASESTMSDGDGVQILQTNNLILVFVNPLIKNLTGIELHREQPIQDFRDYTVKPLYKSYCINDTDTKSETLELVVHISSEAFDKIKIIKGSELVPPNRIIFKFYYKPSLFEQKLNESLHIRPDSKVISITIPNYPMRDYPDGVVTMFRTHSDSTGKNQTCGCSETAIKSSPKWGWASKIWGKQEPINKMVICPVRHPGDIGFAKLVGIPEPNAPYAPTPLSHKVEILLKYTTIIACILSIIGLTLIFVTAIFNPAWRRTEATTLILNVSASSMFLIVMYYGIEYFGKRHAEYCAIVGILVHYAVLVGFFISVIVTNCQYHRYIVVFGNSVPKHLNLRIYLFGWFAPSLIVSLCYALASESYVTNYYDIPALDPTSINPEITRFFCFPTKLCLYVGLHIPIIVIFCYNLSIYVWIIYRVRQEPANLRKTPSKTTVFVQIRLFFYLFFVLSITWIFALLYYYTRFKVFAWIFNFTGTTQGCCLAVFCLFVHQETRSFWIRKLKCSNKAYYVT